MERSKKKLPKDKPRLIKFDESELERIQRLADRYTNGNFSRWVREAAVRDERPRKREESSILQSLGMVD